LIKKHGLTNLFTVPTILKMLVEDPSVDRHDHSSLRYVVYAGAPMYRTDQKLALEKLGPVLVQYYGLAEATGTITVLPAREHEAGDEERRPGTCGFERTGMQVSVQDEDGKELQAGETGEICVIGPAVFAGYFENPEANAKSFRNGWFRTGDLGYRDEAGYIYLTGRSSDMYISGGSNIYPREIEEKVLTHEAISEVAVVGVPDAKWGEVGVAVCVLRQGAQLDEAALLAWMSNRVARYKVPKRVLFWDALPKSGYGKVPKKLVKEELARRGLLTASGNLHAPH
jgi:fatty-acyl-CoA synthase